MRGSGPLSLNEEQERVPEAKQLTLCRKAHTARSPPTFQANPFQRSDAKLAVSPQALDKRFVAVDIALAVRMWEVQTPKDKAVLMGDCRNVELELPSKYFGEVLQLDSSLHPWVPEPTALLVPRGRLLPKSLQSCVLHRDPADWYRIYSYSFPSLTSTSLRAAGSILLVRDHILNLLPMLLLLGNEERLNNG